MNSVMHLGCGIDRNYAQEYAKTASRRSFISLGVLVMPLRGNNRPVVFLVSA